MYQRKFWPALAIALALGACSDNNDNNGGGSTGEPEPPVEPTAKYSAELRRTEYGIRMARRSPVLNTMQGFPTRFFRRTASRCSQPHVTKQLNYGH